MLSTLNLKLIFLLLIFSHFTHASELNRGDSLFTQQKYTEALLIYQDLFQQNQYSSSMLLKMAFINDGLGNYPEALYLLDLYYQKTADRSVVSKINQISEENGLLGYQYDDSNFFKALLNKYRIQAQLSLLSLIVLLSAYIYRTGKKEGKAVPLVVLQVIVLSILVMVSNGFFKEKHGIVQKDQTLLRSGPSAGGEPIELISKGHKVKVLEELPAWTKINWEGQEVYVRKGKVRSI